MPSPEINEYYDVTKNRVIRSDLVFACDIVDDPRVAVDCGCGAGADIEYLLASGFKVYGFDIEDESISRCKNRFKNNNNVFLSKASFSSYKYPKSSLVVADASLFFCPENEFESVWKNIKESLLPDGIFCGSFLGSEDTMAGSTYDNSSYWPKVLVFEEEEVRDIFKSFEICRFTEHKTSGKSPQGVAHDWHIYSVVARNI